MHVRNVIRGRRQIRKESVFRWSSFLFMASLIISLSSLLIFHMKVTPRFFHDILENFSFKLKIYEDLPLSAIPKIQDIPVYFINLKDEVERRQLMKKQLQELGFVDINHVDAWTGDDVNQRVNQLVTSIDNLIRPNNNEIACIASHLWAIYSAITDPLNSSPYAIILEDDTNFQFTVDWRDMLNKAPEDFAILQLGSSNAEQQVYLWNQFKGLFQNIPAEPNRGFAPDIYGSEEEMIEQLARYQWSLRTWESTLWSTQGYVIRKDKLRELIKKFVAFNYEKNRFEITLLPLTPQFPCHQRPCILPFRVVADIYLYSAFQPTYISRIPLLNGDPHHEFDALLYGNATVATNPPSEAIQEENPLQQQEGLEEEPKVLVEEEAQKPQEVDELSRLVQEAEAEIQRSFQEQQREDQLEEALVGFTSIQDVKKVKEHLKSFSEIEKVVLEATHSYRHILPEYFLHSAYHPRQPNVMMMANPVVSRRSLLRRVSSESSESSSSENLLEKTSVKVIEADRVLINSLQEQLNRIDDDYHPPVVKEIDYNYDKEHEERTIENLHDDCVKERHLRAEKEREALEKVKSKTFDFFPIE